MKPSKDSGHPTLLLQRTEPLARLRPAIRRVACALCVMTVVTVPASAAPAAGPTGEPVRIESSAFGRTAVIEVVPPPGGGEAIARDAAREAATGMVALDRHLAEAVDRLNGTSGTSPGGTGHPTPGLPSNERQVVVDREVADLLSRTLKFCDWSGGAHGPLGGVLQEHWRAVGANPTPPPVPPAATQSAACNHLAVDPEDKGARVRVRIAAGSRVDLSGFAAGFAVDRAIDGLRDRGFDNARVRLGRIVRAIGDGPGGDGPAGWPTLLPTFEGYDGPLEKLTLHDQAVAVVWRADWPADHPLFVDQRTGAPPSTAWATVVVTELAVDAQALAVSALVLGSREGRFRIAGLKPVPSVLWLQGTGQGRPLIMELNWTALRNP